MKFFCHKKDEVMSFSEKIMQLNIIKLIKLRWSQKDNIVRFFSHSWTL